MIYGIQTKSHKVNYSQAPTCFCKVIAFCGLWFIRYANEEAGDHCHVKILDLYLSKLPAGFSREAFYYKPLSSTPSFGIQSK